VLTGDGWRHQRECSEYKVQFRCSSSAFCCLLYYVVKPSDWFWWNSSKLAGISDCSWFLQAIRASAVFTRNRRARWWFSGATLSSEENRGFVAVRVICSLFFSRHCNVIILHVELLDVKLFRQRVIVIGGSRAWFC